MGTGQAMASTCPDRHRQCWRSWRWRRPRLLRCCDCQTTATSPRSPGQRRRGRPRERTLQPLRRTCRLRAPACLPRRGRCAASCRRTHIGRGGARRQAQATGRETGTRIRTGLFRPCTSCRSLMRTARRRRWGRLVRPPSRMLCIARCLHVPAWGRAPADGAGTACVRLRSVPTCPPPLGELRSFQIGDRAACPLLSRRRLAPLPLRQTCQRAAGARGDPSLMCTWGLLPLRGCRAWTAGCLSWRSMTRRHGRAPVRLALRRPVPGVPRQRDGAAGARLAPLAGPRLHAARLAVRRGLLLHGAANALHAWCAAPPAACRPAHTRFSPAR